MLYQVSGTCTCTRCIILWEVFLIVPELSSLQISDSARGGTSNHKTKKFRSSDQHSMVSHTVSPVGSSNSLNRVSPSVNSDECFRDVLQPTLKKPRGVSSCESVCTTEPHPHDVLCGRGGFVNKHPGNIVFRRIVEANKERYRSCQVDHKLLLSQSIIDVIRNQAPPGRFLRQSSGGNGWVDAGDTKALQKTSQALREGATDDASATTIVGEVSASVVAPAAGMLMRPTQQHGSPYHQGALEQPNVISSQQTNSMSQAFVSAGVQVSSEESMRSSQDECSTTDDSASKSSRASSMMTSEEIETSDTLEECLALNDDEFDCFSDEASFLNFYTALHFIDACDIFPDDLVLFEKS